MWSQTILYTHEHPGDMTEAYEEQNVWELSDNQEADRKIDQSKDKDSALE